MAHMVRSLELLRDETSADADCDSGCRPFCISAKGRGHMVMCWVSSTHGQSARYPAKKYKK